MEGFLIWVAILCFGVAFLIVVVALITKPRRMRKKAQREAEAKAKELAEIYGRVAVARVKLGGLKRATDILEEARKDDVAK